MTAVKHSNHQDNSSRRGSFFARMARKVTDWSGTTTAFFLAVLLIVIWAASRPLFQSFDTWQLVINTLTTIITFLMVFLIQRAQNKDSHAIHLKLNELVAATAGASNRLVNAEDLSEAEVELLRRHFNKLVELARADEELCAAHSVEEATHRHHAKRSQRLTRSKEPAKRMTDQN